MKRFFLFEQTAINDMQKNLWMNFTISQLFEIIAKLEVCELMTEFLLIKFFFIQLTLNKCDILKAICVVYFNPWWFNPNKIYGTKVCRFSNCWHYICIYYWHFCTIFVDEFVCNFYSFTCVDLFSLNHPAHCTSFFFTIILLRLLFIK